MATFHQNLVQSFSNFKNKYIVPLTPDTRTQTLTAGETEVTFTGIPTNGNYKITLYTSKAGLEYTDVNDSTSGELTYTFEEQESDVTCYLELYLLS